MRKIFTFIAVALVALAVNAKPQTLYLDASTYWNYDNAKFGVYAFEDGKEAVFSDIMTLVSGETTVYTTTIPEGYTHVVFMRLADTATVVDWTRLWNQTIDLTIPDANDFFTITGWNGGDPNKAIGSWSLYEHFFITGNTEELGQWDATAIPSFKDTAILNLPAGSYQMKVTLGSWSEGKSKGVADLTERAEGLQDCNGNIGFILPAAGEVKVIYTGSVFKLIGDFYNTPVYKTYFATGAGWSNDDQSTAVYDAVNEKVTVTMVPSKEAQWQAQVWYNSGVVAKADKFYTISVKLKSNLNMGGVIVKYQNTQQICDSTNISLVADTEKEITFTKEIGKDGGDGMLIFDFGYAPANSTVEIYDISILEEPPTLANGYYIMGYNDNWDLAGLTSTELFAANPAKDGEYMLNITLAEGKSFQVVKVYMDELTNWYPGGAEGEKNYQVDAEHAGAMTVYFNPAGGQDGWHYGYIYVAPRTPEAVAKDFEIDMQTDIFGGALSKYLYIDGEDNYNYSDDAPLEYNAHFAAQGFTAGHGYHQLVATLPVEAGDYKVTLGKCQYAFSADYTTAYVKTNDGSQTLAQCEQNTVSGAEGGVCYHQNPATNVAEMEFTVAEAQMVKIHCAHYTPYIKVERVQPPTGIINTEVGEKAVKRIENGQLIIEKAGKKYNAIGVEIK